MLVTIIFSKALVIVRQVSLVLFFHLGINPGKNNQSSCKFRYIHVKSMAKCNTILCVNTLYRHLR